MYLGYKSFFAVLIAGLLGIGFISLLILAGPSRTVVATSSTSGGKINLIPLTSTTAIRGAETTPTTTQASLEVSNANSPKTSSEKAAAKHNAILYYNSTPKPSFLKAISAEKTVITQVTNSAPVTCSGNFVNELLCLLNQYRASKGKGQVSGSSALSAVALSHSVWMNSTGTFSHEGKDGSRLGDRCAAAGITCRAENLAFNVSSAQKVLNMWIASPSHNTNLLGNYKTIGIGISGDYTTLLFN